MQRPHNARRILPLCWNLVIWKSTALRVSSHRSGSATRALTLYNLACVIYPLPLSSIDFAAVLFLSKSRYESETWDAMRSGEKKISIYSTPRDLRVVTAENNRGIISLSPSHFRRSKTYQDDASGRKKFRLTIVLRPSVANFRESFAYHQRDDHIVLRLRISLH